MGHVRVLRDGLPILLSNFRFIITPKLEQIILTFTSLWPLNVQILDLDHRVEKNKLDVSTHIKHELEKLKSLETLRVPQDWPWGKACNV